MLPICHFRNEKRSGASCNSQLLVGPLQGTKWRPAWRRVEWDRGFWTSASPTLFSRFLPLPLWFPPLCFFCCKVLHNVANKSYFSQFSPPWESCFPPTLFPSPVYFLPPLLPGSHPLRDFYFAILGVKDDMACFLKSDELETTVFLQYFNRHPCPIYSKWVELSMSGPSFLWNLEKFIVVQVVWAGGYFLHACCHEAMMREREQPRLQQFWTILFKCSPWIAFKLKIFHTWTVPVGKNWNHSRSLFLSALYLQKVSPAVIWLHEKFINCSFIFMPISLPSLIIE